MTDREPTIVGIGTYLPEDLVTNDELVRRTGLETSNEEIVKRTGIEERHYAANDEPTSQIGTMAAKHALSNAEIPTENYNTLVATSSSFDDSAGVAPRIHKNTELPEECLSYDSKGACTGGVIALQQVANRIAFESEEAAGMVVGISRLSRVADFKDRKSAIIFGDGAGAAVVKNVEGSKRPKFVFYTRSNPEAIRIPGGGDLLPLQGPDDPNGKLHMNGHEVADNAIELMTKAAVEVAKKDGVYNEDEKSINWDEIDLFVPHQANLRLMEKVAEELGAPKEKTAVIVNKIGNTSGSSIFFALEEAYLSGQLTKPHARVLFTAIGAGFSAGAGLIDVELPGQAPVDEEK